MSQHDTVAARLDELFQFGIDRSAMALSNGARSPRATSSRGRVERSARQSVTAPSTLARASVARRGASCCDPATIAAIEQPALKSCSRTRWIQPVTNASSVETASARPLNARIGQVATQFVLIIAT